MCLSSALFWWSQCLFPTGAAIGPAQQALGVVVPMGILVLYVVVATANNRVRGGWRAKTIALTIPVLVSASLTTAAVLLGWRANASVLLVVGSYVLALAFTILGLAFVSRFAGEAFVTPFDEDDARAEQSVRVRALALGVFCLLVVLGAIAVLVWMGVLAAQGASVSM